MGNMRAFLVMLMLTLLPLQFSAAAVLACHGCGAVSEQPQTRQHSPATASAVTGLDTLAADTCGLECGCHAHCVAMVAAAARFLDAAAMKAVAPLAAGAASPWDERPERPQWPAAQARG